MDWKDLLISLLSDMAESKGLLVQLTATNFIAASLYRGGKLHSLLGIGVDDKDSSQVHTKLSKYSPHSQRGEFIRALSQLIVDEASMM